MTSQVESDRSGEIVGGKYRLVRLLARGGMGVVYEAQHAVVRRRFAIKFLRRDLAERRDILTRFQREAEAAGALENENVAAVVDFGIAADGTPYLVMEYLVGESLAALLQRVGRLPVGRAADLIAQACRGVAAAHAAGIVHRDLKPQNLFVSRRDDGTDLVKVLDFGVAKLHALDEESAATQTGTMLGTAAYMSPEQARGEKTVDARTDVYALAAILYELLSLQRPHPGDSQNAILHHIATHQAVPIGTLEPEVPGAVAELLARALASDAAARPATVQALGQALASFAQREIWPAASEAPDPTTRGAGQASRASSPVAPPAPRRRAPVVATLATALLAAIAVFALARRSAAPPPAPPPEKKAPHRIHRLDPATRFLGDEPPPGAAAQIDSLLKANRTRDAALVSAMVATPAGIWFLGGSPEQVRAAVSDAIARGGRQGRVPVLVAYNHPFRDCTGYGLSGAADTTSYHRWIDGFAAGIGNENVIVILEPISLGLIPQGHRLDGEPDPCRPTRAGPDGQRVAVPEATPDERYALLGYAVDALATRAPNAAVYLDGTHSAWLSVRDAAYRLARAGVDRTAGFALNAGNYQPTGRLIQYGTWVAKCLYRAATAGGERLSPDAYRSCASQYDAMDPSDDTAWAKVDAWYVENVDRGPHPPRGPDALTHFVIDTNRNGRGPLDVSVYARPPYNQPPAVIEALRNGAWCMPPGRGLGFRPTADTGVPLVDAYLWMSMPGETVVTCDIAGGARAWDYSRYNPWGITGDAQKHFDPLWGRVLPPSGDWFPDHALGLIRNAEPPLGQDVPGQLREDAPKPRPSRTRAPAPRG